VVVCMTTMKPDNEIGSNEKTAYGNVTLHITVSVSVQSRAMNNKEIQRKTDAFKICFCRKMLRIS